jgi:hypothetical protein
MTSKDFLFGGAQDFESSTSSQERKVRGIMCY